MKKGLFKKAAAVSLSMALGLALVPAGAFALDGATVSKAQVVYVKGAADGDAEGVYVVNRFSSDGVATVTDEGTYLKVTNLTDGQALGAAGERSFTVSAGTPFLYQGDLATEVELPWNVKATYTLDGKEVSPEVLAGASGSLGLGLEISVNEGCKGDYKDAYLLQVTGSLDNDTCSEIVAADATCAQAGGSTQLTYMVFPGKDASYTVTAKVKDFEFDGWQLVGIPLSMALDLTDEDVGGAGGELSELSDATSAVSEGAQELSRGVDDLKGGADSLASGLGGLSSGLTALEGSNAQLVSGADSLSDGVSQLVDGARSLDSAINDQLVPGAVQLAAGSSAYAGGLTQQAESMKAAAAAVDVGSARSAYEQAAQAYVLAYGAAYASAVQSGQSGEAAVAAALSATSGEQAAMASALEAFVTAQATQSGYAAGAEALGGADGQYAQIDSAIQGLADPESESSVYALSAGVSQLGGGLQSLSAGVDSLASGIASYTGGVAQAATGSEKLSSGAGALSSGVAKAASGAQSLASGASELADATADIDTRVLEAVKDQIEEYLNPDYEARDFVTGSTKGIDNVQFVYTTAAVNIDDVETVEDEPEEEEKGFLERLLALFFGD